MAQTTTPALNVFTSTWLIKHVGHFYDVDESNESLILLFNLSFMGHASCGSMFIVIPVKCVFIKFLKCALISNQLILCIYFFSASSIYELLVNNLMNKFLKEIKFTITMKIVQVMISNQYNWMLLQVKCYGTFLYEKNEFYSMYSKTYHSNFMRRFYQ